MEEDDERIGNNSLKRSADEVIISDASLSTDSSESAGISGEPQKKKRKRSSFFRVLKSSSPSPSLTPRRSLPRVTPKSALKSVTFNLPNDDDDHDDDDHNDNGGDGKDHAKTDPQSKEDPENPSISERSFLDVVGIHTPVARRMSRAEALRRTLDEMDAPIRPLKFGEDESEDGTPDGAAAAAAAEEAKMDVNTEDTLQREWTVKSVLKFYTSGSFEWAVPTEDDKTFALTYANDLELPQNNNTNKPGANIAHAVQYFVLRNGEGKDGKLLDALNSLYALERSGALQYFYVLGESFAMVVRGSSAYVHPPSILRAFTSKMNMLQQQKNNDINSKNNIDKNDSDNKEGKAKDNEPNYDDFYDDSEDDDDDSDSDTSSPLRSEKMRKKRRRLSSKKNVTSEERELEALRENSNGFVPVRMPGDLTIEEVLAMAAESIAKPPEVVQDPGAVRALFEGLAASSLAARAVVLAPKAFPGGALERAGVRMYPVHKKMGPGVFEDFNAVEIAGYVFNDRFRKIVSILKYSGGDVGGGVDESFSADIDVVQSTAYFNGHSASSSLSSSSSTSSLATASSVQSTPGKLSSSSTAGLFVSGLKWSKNHGSLSYTLTKK